jgi:hypothetical protein
MPIRLAREEEFVTRLRGFLLCHGTPQPARPFAWTGPGGNARGAQGVGRPTREKELVDRKGVGRCNEWLWALQSLRWLRFL